MALPDEGGIFFVLRNITSKKLSYSIIALTSLYIIGPSLRHVLSTLFGSKRITEDKSNKRLDKYTTGLTNRANECYINSSLQALSSLQNLTISLNKYIKLTENANEEGDLKETISRALLHESLCNLFSSLQQLILQPRISSNKPVVQALESIFQGRLSRDQNDAHEFVQILLEKLWDEHKMLSQLLGDSNNFKFPFQGTTTSHYFCMRCHKRSEILKQDQLIWGLNVPQKFSCSLDEVIEESGNEMIEDYSCLYCQVSILLANEANDNFYNSETEKENVETLKSLLPVLKINSDIPDELAYYIKNYNKNRCVPSRTKTTIVKRTYFSKSPDSLVIHLSRSIYNGMVLTRNSCRVSFPEELKVTEQHLDDSDRFQTVKVKYFLKSMVKHTGSHYQGHYQCYKRKPELVLSSATRKIINKTPTIRGRHSLNDKSEKVEIEPVSNIKKFKKMKSVRSLPFWHISDEKVKEVRSSSLQNEEKYVYMLYYEKLN